LGKSRSKSYLRDEDVASDADADSDSNEELRLGVGLGLEVVQAQTHSPYKLRFSFFWCGIDCIWAIDGPMLINGVAAATPICLYLVYSIYVYVS